MERSEQTQSAQPSEQQRAGRRRPLSIGLRVALIAVVVLAMVLLAHVLRHPAGFGGENVEGSGQAASAQGWPPEVDFSGAPPPPDEEPTTAEEADDNLRHLMAGLIMAALGEGDEGDARDTEPTDQQRRIADLFALPYDYPQSQAPADLMPEEAKVLMVFDNPVRRGCRMVLVRMPKSMDAALEAFHRHYELLGWECERLESPRANRGAQPDRGWLVHFRKVRDGRMVRQRVVYARARSGGDETLVAIYDPNYGGE
ncbi:MAG: hypothetical protein U9R68_00740 [Planctomycetota bacterium]|nr:hypothetical protein [Planctomycetota bacterium]